MKNTSFLEELEKRLSDLEKEISKTVSVRNRKDMVMKNMFHHFDSAMDNEPGTENTDPALFEKRFRYMDY